MIKSAISKIIEALDLNENEMVKVFEEIMSGEATDAQIGAFITALRIKGETVSEITGAARVMREKAVTIKIATKGSIVDTCGTGGDCAGTFNISTTAAFVAAGAGLIVAKHGNKSVSSKSGSADVLSSLGINIGANTDIVEKCLKQVGIGFLFAPLMHGAMKYAIGPRKEIGIRTIFNVLGPLTNPAGATSQIIGVYKKELTEPIAKVLKELGSKHVFVVHGSDGLDEITLTGNTYVSEMVDNEIKNYEISPEQYGMKICNSNELSGGDPLENSKITLEILKGQKGAKRDIVVLNAAAAITVGGKAENLKEGIKLARDSIDSGSALRKLEELKVVSNEDLN